MGMAAVILAAAACQGTDTGAGDRRDRRDERAADILAHLAALPAAEVVQVDDDAIPHFVTGNLGSLALAERIEETDFRAALSAIAPVLSADAGELSLRRARTDEQGDRHFPTIDRNHLRQIATMTPDACAVNRAITLSRRRSGGRYGWPINGRLTLLNRHPAV